MLWCLLKQVCKRVKVVFLTGEKLQTFYLSLYINFSIWFLYGKKNSPYSLHIPNHSIEEDNRTKTTNLQGCNNSTLDV